MRPDFEHCPETALGDRLRAIREHLQISRHQVTERTGLRESVLSDLETRRQRTTGRVGTLARALGVDAYWLETGVIHDAVQPIRPPAHEAPSAASIGRRIRQRRHALGIPAKALAASLQVSSDVLESIEVGLTIPDAVMVARLSVLMACPTDALLLGQQPLDSANPPCELAVATVADMLANANAHYIEQLQNVLAPPAGGRSR